MSSSTLVSVSIAPVESSPDPHSHNLRDRSNRIVWTDLDERGMPTRCSPLWKPPTTSTKVESKSIYPGKVKTRPLKTTKKVDQATRHLLRKRRARERSQALRVPSTVPVPPSLVDLPTRANLLNDIRSLRDLGKE
ncbi:hypothetical protein P7C70_g4665, partial [Phenoliferia sp. Uapishka_3]